jgi:LacI family transcriptional regulator
MTQPEPTAPRSLTIRDIAKACGVGKTTVAAAIYGTGRVSEGTRGEILRVAAELGYDPAQQTAARRLAQRKSKQPVLNHTLGLFSSLHLTAGTYTGEPYRGMAEVCTRERFAILLTYLPPQAFGHDPTYQLPSAFARGDADGAILVGFQGPLIGILRALPGFGDRPLVSLFQPAEGASSVTSDDRQGTRDATRQLLAEGHRHFLHLYAPAESPIPRMRVAGIHDALRAAGLAPTAHLAGLDLPSQLLNPLTAPHVLPREGAPAQDITLGADILLPYLRAHPEITAIFCENDPMALHLWHLLHNAGLRVPDDISLVGFDDTDGMLDTLGINHLTTIRLPLYEMGRTATELLIQRITGHQPTDEQRILPVDFLARRSTAPPGSARAAGPNAKGDRIAPVS